MFKFNLSTFLFYYSTIFHLVILVIKPSFILHNYCHSCPPSAMLLRKAEPKKKHEKRIFSLALFLFYLSTLCWLFIHCAYTSSYIEKSSKQASICMWKSSEILQI